MTPKDPAEPLKIESEQPFLVKKGVCYACYAYDIGLSIDLDKCRQLTTVADYKFEIAPRERVNGYSAFAQPPLLLSQKIAPIAIAHFRTRPEVVFLLNDFGGVSVSYHVPFSGSFDEMLSLSRFLRENDVLIKESRRRVTQLLETFSSLISRPLLADMVEDYVIFQIEEIDCPYSPDVLHRNYAQQLAQVLRAANQNLSQQEVSDALQCRINYSKHDLVLVDWNAALVVDKEVEALNLLEFANIELLEMRVLDQQLDNSLDKAYEVISRKKQYAFKSPTSPGDMHLVAQMQMDGAVLFERVNNVLKLVGDQYLARVYRLVSRRFHLAEWDSSILRKLEVLEGLYDKMNDRNDSHRLEVLEWIVIILIAIEIVLSLYGLIAQKPL